MKALNDYAINRLLRGVAIGTWTIVIIMIIGLIFATAKASANARVQSLEEAAASQIERVVFNTENVIPPIVQKSIGICKNELIAADMANAVYEASKKFNIPCYVIYAIISTESSKYGTKQMTQENFMEVNFKAKSNCDCRGLMQISIYALNEYNKYFQTDYTMEDLWDIRVNILVGTWYYSQFRTNAYVDAENYGVSVWTVMYVIYNVGPGSYYKVNSHWFYDWDGKWTNTYRQRFFFLNDMYPPTDDRHGLYGKNRLNYYGSKNRFNRCLELCKEYFFN